MRSQSNMEHHSTTIQNPGSFEISDKFKTVLYAFFALGIVTFLVGLKADPNRAWATFVLNHFYFMCLGLGGIFFAAIQWVSNAMWSAPIRRLSEAFAAYLPVVLVTFAILYFGIPHLYIWSHPEHVQGDLV